MHEFKELVDNRLEELPVGTQEPWVLPYNVHDVGCDDGLIVFPSLLLTQPQQVLKCTHTVRLKQIYQYRSLLIWSH